MTQLYELGAKLTAQIGGCDVFILADDITKCEFPEHSSPSIWWVNPPISKNSMEKFKRNASRTTALPEETGSLAEIYRTIAGLMEPDDAYIMMIPDTDGVDKFVEGLGIAPDQMILGSLQVDKPASVSVADMRRPSGKSRRKADADAPRMVGKTFPVRLYTRGLGSSLPKKTGISEDTKVNFVRLTKGVDLSQFKAIIDPCCGHSPLLQVALQNRLDYYGVELSGGLAFRIRAWVERRGPSQYSAQKTSKPKRKQGNPTGVRGRLFLHGIPEGEEPRRAPEPDPEPEPEPEPEECEEEVAEEPEAPEVETDETE
jgi:hypothetical protein